MNRHSTFLFFDNMCTDVIVGAFTYFDITQGVGYMLI